MVHQHPLPCQLIGSSTAVVVPMMTSASIPSSLWGALPSPTLLSFSSLTSPPSSLDPTIEGGGGPLEWSVSSFPRGGGGEDDPSNDHHPKGSSHHHKNNNKNNNKEADTIVQEILQAKNDYYAVLGLTRTINHKKRHSKHQSPTHNVPSPTPTEQEITKAYRKRALQTHPDKTGGDRSAFDLVAKAYEVLGDPQQRAIYDRYGVEGLESGLAGAGGGAASPRAASSARRASAARTV